MWCLCSTAKSVVEPLHGSYLSSYIQCFLPWFNHECVDLKVLQPFNTVFKKLCSPHWKARPPMYSLCAVFWKARGWNLLPGCWLKAKSERKRIILKYLHYYVWKRCTFLKVHHWSILHQSLLSSLCPPPFLSVLFHQGPQVKGSSSCLRLFRILRVWPLTFHVTAPCRPFILNLTQQYEWRRSRAEQAGSMREHAWNSAAGLHLCTKTRGCELLWSHNNFMFGDWSSQYQ